MRRREFIALAAGAAFAAPLSARAQNFDRTRRVGFLINYPASEPEAKRRIDVFVEAMDELGWVEGKNLHVDYRFDVDPKNVKNIAAEVSGLAPDAILATAPPSVVALQHTTKAIPVVFVAVTDPITLGIVDNLAHPGANVTGFSSADVGISGK